MKEIFSVTSEERSISSELGKIREIFSKREKGCGIRITDGKKFGSAHASSIELLPKKTAMVHDFHGWGDGGESLFSDSFEIRSEELASQLQNMISELEGVNANFVSVGAENVKRSIENPNLSLSESLSALSAQAFVTTESSVGFEYSSSRSDIDFSKIAKKAKEMALKSENPGRAEPGKMAVTLKPKAVASLISPLISALSGHEVLSGRSPLSGKIGEEISSLKIIDNPRSGGTSSCGFDDEGSKTKKLDLIDKTLNSFLHTVETAKKLNGEPGNGSRDYNTIPMPRSTNIIVKGPKREEGRLVVDWVSGTHTIPPSGDFSVEAKSAFQDEKPVSNLMISGNIFEMIKEAGLFGKRRDLGSISTPSWTVDLDVVA